MNLHHLISVTGNQTNTKFTGWHNKVWKVLAKLNEWISYSAHFLLLRLILTLCFKWLKLNGKIWAAKLMEPKTCVKNDEYFFSPKSKFLWSSIKRNMWHRQHKSFVNPKSKIHFLLLLFKSWLMKPPHVGSPLVIVEVKSFYETMKNTRH